MLQRVVRKLVGAGTAAGMSVGALLGVGTLQAAQLAAAPSAAAVTVHSSARSSASSTGTATAKVHLPKRCRVKGRVLCADKTTRKLYFVRDGVIRKTTAARFGCAGYRHTREGTFKVYRKNKHWVSTIYHTPMPYSMFFSGGQAVHFSSDFAARGYAGCSHGCINVRNMTKLKWMYARIHVGDRVVVFWS